MNDLMQSQSAAEAYVLPQSVRERFRREGHVHVRALGTRDEIDRVRPALNEIVARHRETELPIEERDTYGKAFLQAMNLWQRDRRVAEFVQNPRYARVAAELLGVPAVRLYHDQALFKEAGGGHTPWHQDRYYWPLDTDACVTLWMPLVDLDPDMGLLQFADGSHLDGMLQDLGISDESEKLLDNIVSERGLAVSGPDSMHAGDATFHAGWTLHRAKPNASKRMREVMTVIYFADGTRIAEPDSDARRRDLEGWLPGCKPGDLAASPLNPLLYSRDG